MDGGGWTGLLDRFVGWEVNTRMDSSSELSRIADRRQRLQTADCGQQTATADSRQRQQARARSGAELARC